MRQIAEQNQRLGDRRVAPITGAWVEPSAPEAGPTVAPSRPSRARGLKLRLRCNGHDEPLVARITGAWVEASLAASLLRDTPLTEADLLEMARQAAGASFMPEAAKKAALAAVDAAPA